ncbi:hypothetical protein CHUV2995_02948 [Corynebacterium diphtheriae subsp. lausannense]|nr:hypothetical protein [Corynebacterium belfantii]SPJ42114.1 hypothetical protein CHUV2995_02948 [Corynebacterium diphtheriae subsp. lausannense]
MVHQIQHTAPALLVRTDIARCLRSPIYYTDQGSITATHPVYFSGVTPSLYKVAVGALATVAIVVYVLYGGLLAGDWEALKTLAVFICAAAIAMMAPGRITAAERY